eukprot:1151293-Pelagomonas_calceolata.AAC.1
MACMPRTTKVQHDGAQASMYKVHAKAVHKIMVKDTACKGQQESSEQPTLPSTCSVKSPPSSPPAPIMRPTCTQEKDDSRRGQIQLIPELKVKALRLDISAHLAHHSSHGLLQAHQLAKALFKDGWEVEKAEGMASGCGVKYDAAVIKGLDLQRRMCVPKGTAKGPRPRTLEQEQAAQYSEAAGICT